MRVEFKRKLDILSILVFIDETKPCLPRKKGAGTAFLRVPAQLHHLLNLHVDVQWSNSGTAMKVRNKYSHKFDTLTLKAAKT